ncbi:hypothetical protein NC99_32350 [Sunxiuqinia dokdonensis]|uniref:Uncharacterized protein n=1 Tax=Sunxiuqinia dokdonensis TaxID=1409788 RepID=A0A0L8V672_9BACT|nr:hypothetical protein NC99_32350 [Sunxiuqinia dokdonensis]
MGRSYRIRWKWRNGTSKSKKIQLKYSAGKLKHLAELLKCSPELLKHNSGQLKHPAEHLKRSTDKLKHAPGQFKHPAEPLKHFIFVPERVSSTFFGVRSALLPILTAFSGIRATCLGVSNTFLTILKVSSSALSAQKTI